MSAQLIQDRTLIRMAVFDGVLDESHLTMDDLYDMEDTVFELLCDKLTPFTTWETVQ